MLLKKYLPQIKICTKQDIIVGVYQEYIDESPLCNRFWSSGKNLVEDSSLWTVSIPHAQESGKCFTYKYAE